MVLDHLEQTIQVFLRLVVINPLEIKLLQKIGMVHLGLKLQIYLQVDKNLAELEQQQLDYHLVVEQALEHL